MTPTLPKSSSHTISSTPDPNLSFLEPVLDSPPLPSPTTRKHGISREWKLANSALLWPEAVGLRNPMERKLPFRELGHLRAHWNDVGDIVLSGLEATVDSGLARE
mmetsp:Transcript_1207/g.2539  ORF Transcript_1207/g.2539 Transcript_1207/m.2539 type:complete len:105 (+) Transcript_1207:1610-1924(+)